MAVRSTAWADPHRLSHGGDLPEPHHPPRGHWIMCGYGRFGHGIRDALTKAGNEVTVIDKLHYGEKGVDIEGTGTDSASLINAGIEHSVGIVAGNASDLKNLAHRAGGPRPQARHLHRLEGRTR
ncbi:MAG: NAD-binding protein [Micropruina glycogenica]